MPQPAPRVQPSRRLPWLILPCANPDLALLPSCKAGGQGDWGLLQAEAPNGWESCGAPEVHPNLDSAFRITFWQPILIGQVL